MRFKGAWAVGFAVLGLCEGAWAQAWRVGGTACPNGRCYNGTPEVWDSDETRASISAARSDAMEHANSRVEAARGECQAKLDDHARQLNDAIVSATGTLDGRVLTGPVVETLRQELRRTIEAEVRRQLEIVRAGDSRPTE